MGKQTWETLVDTCSDKWKPMGNNDNQRQIPSQEYRDHFPEVVAIQTDLEQ
jgi:hypothetical protein